MPDRKRFLLRIDPALYRQLAAMAAQELRSVNGQIEYMLKDAVRKRGRKLPESEPPASDGD